MAQDIKGLSSREATERLRHDGPNEITEKKTGPLKRLVTWLISPIALMLIAAAILSYASGRQFDGNFILLLLALNFVVSQHQEHKADRAVSELQSHLQVTVRVMRDNNWTTRPSRELVEGDIIKLGLGNVIPADAEVATAVNLTINQAALTGESLPIDRKPGDDLFSGSFILTGQTVCRVIATGHRTRFGQTIKLVTGRRKRSILEQDILRISTFLSVLSLVGIIVITIALSLEHFALLDILTLDLSLVIAGIPVSLPTVMTLIMSLGVVELAKRKAIVRRLSSLEDLANVNLLLTDKTGTLTKNLIAVEKIIAYEPFEDKEVMTWAQAGAWEDDQSVITKAVLDKAKTMKLAKPEHLSQFIPADSKRKRSTVVVTADKQSVMVSLGAPQVVAKLCHLTRHQSDALNQDITAAANNGYRALAVAVNRHGAVERDMTLVGLLLLSDQLYTDTGEIIEFLHDNGVGVKILTGDNRSISQRIAATLKIAGDVVTHDTLHTNNYRSLSRQELDKIGVFSEILPEDKLDIVKRAETFYTVAATGDGVNDLPALKASNVSLAVHSAVDALKSTADIVLLSTGITVIKNAIIEARKIFARIYSYSVYRISESLRLIVTIVVLGLVIRAYPLTPVQLILLALLNDIPIISMAYDRVRATNRPAAIDVRGRFILSSLFGLAGVANSLILFFIVRNIFHLDWPVVQTIYFLKLTVSGHLLLYVAHTDRPWYRFLPAPQVIWATLGTQAIATVIAVSGWFMPAPISIGWALVVWIWAFLWMQITEAVKQIHHHA